MSPEQIRGDRRGLPIRSLLVRHRRLRAGDRARTRSPAAIRHRPSPHPRSGTRAPCRTRARQLGEHSRARRADAGGDDVPAEASERALSVHARAGGGARRGARRGRGRCCRRSRRPWWWQFHQGLAQPRLLPAAGSAGRRQDLGARPAGARDASSPASSPRSLPARSGSISGSRCGSIRTNGGRSATGRRSGSAWRLRLRRCPRSVGVALLPVAHRDGAGVHWRCGARGAGVRRDGARHRARGVSGF